LEAEALEAEEERQTRREAGAQSLRPLGGGALVTEQRESFGKLFSRKVGKERVPMPRDGSPSTLEP
jgi:hypothetical protein